MLSGGDNQEYRTIMKRSNSKIIARKRRARRARRKVLGTSDRPRLAVSRSLKNVYVQLIDDVAGATLLGISSSHPDIRVMKKDDGGKTAVSKTVGKLVAEKAKDKGISKVVFDRSGFLYHGRVKAVADGAREGGLEF